MTAPTRTTGSAVRLLDEVLDTGSFVSWDHPAGPPPEASTQYRGELITAAEASAADEALISGAGHIGGRRLAVVASEFGFLAGSLGVVAARRLIDAVERATAERLPLLLSPASGGTRMQKGTPAFLEMITIAGAIAVHRRAGLPVVAHFRNPTTGGAVASWGSLGTVTTAEPGALIGFLGPRVARALTGRPLPAGVQTAENLYERGIVDAVADPADLAALLSRLLSLTSPVPAGDLRGSSEVPVRITTAVDTWTALVATRRPTAPE